MSTPMVGEDFTAGVISSVTRFPSNRGDTEQAILECYADMCVGFTDSGGQLVAVNKFSPQEKSGTRYFFRMANAPDHVS